MIQFNHLSKNNILVISLERSEDYVLPQDLISECRLIKKKILEVQVQQIIFVSQGDFWHKNLRIESFETMYDCMNWAKEWRGFLKFIKESSIPTYAFVQGLCEGIGMELALACRFRIGHEAATFSCQDVRHGHLPVGGMLFRLISLVGLNESLKFFLLARPLKASEAKRLGLIHESTPWPFDFRDILLPVLHRSSLLFHLFVEELPWGRGFLFKRWRREILLRFRGHFRSPLKLLDVVERGWFKGGETRAQIEIEAFSELVFSAQAHILEHTHSRLRSFFKVTPQKNLRILFLDPHFRTGTLVGLLANEHSVCVSSSNSFVLENIQSSCGKTRHAIEYSLHVPSLENFDLVFQKNAEQGEVYECVVSSLKQSFFLRFFMPLKERKIIELYSLSSPPQLLMSLFSSIGKFPIWVKGESLVQNSPVIRMALALHQEAHWLCQLGYSKEQVEAVWKDLGMRPQLFELWSESCDDVFDSYSKIFSTQCSDRFSVDSTQKGQLQKEIFLTRLLKEALLLLEEGLIRDPYIIDLLMVYGLGYPRYQGGLLSQVDTEGAALWHEKMLELTKKMGERFAPPMLLRRIVEAKGRIYDRTIL